MNLDLPDDVVELARVCASAFDKLGGVDVSRRAAADPTLRRTEIQPILARLGVTEIDAMSNDATQMLAAAEVCRVAGTVALPYPVAAMLLAGPTGHPVVVVNQVDPRVDHGDLADEWLTVDGAGNASVAHPASAPSGTRLGTFVTAVAFDGPHHAAPHGLAERALTLTSITALGVAQQALALSVAHTRAREQFGKPLASFQSVRFRLAHASTLLAGLTELAHFTVIRIADDKPGSLVDALGLRMHTITVVREVMRTAHQFHGALGFCTEHDLSMLTRAIQPLTRLPFDLSATTDLMLAAVDRYGFEGVFPVSAA